MKCCPGPGVPARHDDPKFGYRFLAEKARAAGQPMVERTAGNALHNVAAHARLERATRSRRVERSSVGVLPWMMPQRRNRDTTLLSSTAIRASPAVAC